MGCRAIYILDPFPPSDHVSSSFHISLEDMEYAPFDTIGGPFRFRKLFGDRADAILDDLNAALAA